MRTIFFFVVVTAMLGVLLFLPLYKKRKAPRLAIYAHGTFAIISVFLLTRSFLHDGTIHLTSMVLFALAALNGLYMFFISEILKRTIPPGLIVLHANLAAIAFISLIYYSIYPEN